MQRLQAGVQNVLRTHSNETSWSLGIKGEYIILTKISKGREMLRVLQAERIAYAQAWRQENVGLKKTFGSSSMWKVMQKVIQAKAREANKDEAWGVF